MLTRRNLLLGCTALTLAGCGTPGTGTDPLAAWNAFVDQVSQIVANGCGVVQGFIPTASTVLRIVEALFPAVGAAAAGINAIAGSVTAVASAICTAAQGKPPALMAARLRTATPLNPVVIGRVIVGGTTTVTVIGYHTRFGPQITTPAMARRYGFHFR